MPCMIDYEIRKKYPNTVVIPYFSSTETNIAQTNAHIPNSPDGYLVGGPEMELLGQDAADVGSELLVANPYPTRLRPMAKESLIFQTNNVFLEKLEWFAYDVTLDGSAVQDAATIAAIYASRAANDTYGQSLYKNALPVNWQPNFFRPSFRIDGKDILNYLSTGNFGYNRGDLSIGIPLPYCMEIVKELGKIRIIEAHAQVAQYIPDTQLFQRYPVLCLATFWYGPSSTVV